MSTAANPITEQAITPTPEQRRGGKKSAEERIAELLRELKAVRQENADLLDRLDRLAAFETADSARKQEAQANWNQFLATCEAVRSSSPEFAEALRRIADIPQSWLSEILRMPNPAGFVFYLGCATQFMEYLREVKPEVAVKRLRQAGYDMHHKLPKLQGGN